MPLANSRWSDALARDLRVVAAILIVGWTIAAGVYVSTPPALENPEVDAEIDEMQHSKKYLRDIERIGGKAAVFATEIDTWVASLWEGRRRAYTIASLTVAVAFGYVLLRRAGRPDSGHEQRRPG